MAKPVEFENDPDIFENPRQIQGQIIRGLRYFIVLHILKAQPMHGYRIITVIRKNFGIYLGPSSVYPLLRDLEDWNYLQSSWTTEDFHPKRIYSLTNRGKNMLAYLENSIEHLLVGMRMTETTHQLENQTRQS
ncbi:MAG: PadR family transcriptional regulator [Candidatus Bathyarchaeia archaeon]|jgi:DNA-binding PadR family transcriptional regulator